MIKSLTLLTAGFLSGAFAIYILVALPAEKGRIQERSEDFSEKVLTGARLYMHAPSLLQREIDLSIQQDLLIAQQQPTSLLPSSYSLARTYIEESKLEVSKTVSEFLSSYPARPKPEFDSSISSYMSEDPDLSVPQRKAEQGAAANP